METDRIDITAQLFALQDKAYADFQSKLLPTVERETVIGTYLLQRGWQQNSNLRKLHFRFS